VLFGDMTYLPLISNKKCTSGGTASLKIGLILRDVPNGQTYYFDVMVILFKIHSNASVVMLWLYYFKFAATCGQSPSIINM
jgi:hypothetical protein